MKQEIGNDDEESDFYTSVKSDQDGADQDFEEINDSDVENSSNDDDENSDQLENTGSEMNNLVSMFSPDVYKIYHKIKNTNPSLSFDLWKPDSEKSEFYLFSASGMNIQNQNAQLSCQRIGNFSNLENPKKREIFSNKDLKSCDELQIASEGLSGFCNRFTNLDHSEFIYSALFQDNQRIGVYKIKKCDLLAKHKNITPKFELVTKLKPKSEGFALSFSKDLKLLSGDNKSKIILTDILKPDSESKNQLKRSHKSSVEDVHWSFNDPNVFASCSSDKSIKIWDARECFQTQNSSLHIAEAHKSDVNVFDWCQWDQNLLISGDDDGLLKIFDTRNSDSGSCFLSEYAWHAAAITSIKSNKHDDKLIAVSSRDNTVSLWDCQNPGEPASKKKKNSQPDDLYFDHRGVIEPREVHWLDENGCVVCDINGFDIFYPIDV